MQLVPELYKRKIASMPPYQQILPLLTLKVNVYEVYLQIELILIKADDCPLTRMQSEICLPRSTKL